MANGRSAGGLTPPASLSFAPIGFEEEFTPTRTGGGGVPRRRGRATSAFTARASRGRRGAPALSEDALDGLDFGRGFGDPGGARRTTGENIGITTQDLLGPGGEAGVFSGPQFLQNLATFGVDQGLFDPTGSRLLDDLIIQSITQSAGAGQRAASLEGEIFGDDPLLRRQATIEATQGLQDQLGSAIARARLESAMRNQAIIQAIIAQFLGGPVSRRDPRERGGGLQTGIERGAAAIPFESF